MRHVLAGLAAVLVAPMGVAAMKTVPVNYTHGDTTFTGLLAYDDAVSEKRAGVLVCPEWWGLDDFAKQRAAELAKMGYVAFACDLYGAGKVVTHPDDAKGMAGAVRKDVQEWRGRAKAALEVLARHEAVDPNRLAAIGYCFGGSTALQLALDGADLKAVATFHAGLPAPTAEEAKKIKGRVLISNGADDTFIPAEAIEKLLGTLKAAGVPVQFDNYPGAVHSFSIPAAAEANIPGMAYNADADRKSWAAMTTLFEKTLRAGQ